MLKDRTQVKEELHQTHTDCIKNVFNNIATPYLQSPFLSLINKIIKHLEYLQYLI